MSPRAACRLETLGFEHVYDYMPGKADWLARGLPSEGDNADAPRGIDFSHDDAVTCGRRDLVGAVRERVATSPHGFALVVTDDRVLLGRIPSATLAGDPTRTAEAAMEPGPSTVRADADPVRLRERLERQDLATAVVSDPDGRLLGVARRADLPAT